MILTACGGAARATPSSEPLVIPPMGAVNGVAIAPPPPQPPAPHFATAEECATIMRKIVDLTLEHSSLDQAQRDEIMKGLLETPNSGPSICSKMKVDDDMLRCVASTAEVETAQKCLAPGNQPEPGGDDDASP